MTKKIAKGKKGEVTQYITRKKAMKRLQLTLKDFRRLCILKGIYPRQPKKKFKGFKKMYFHVKDIKFLAHQKLLDKFRDIAAYTKKVKKAKNRKQVNEAKRLQSLQPKYSLEHLVKERYPNFVDALRDLDDPLCLISLYASFSSHKTLKIDIKIVNQCRRLTNEFYLYLMLTQSLTKAFFSIKGIYFQAEIHGQKITWIIPYKFTPQVISLNFILMNQIAYDVDFDVMGSFLEFYMTLLKFVNFRLYKEIQIKKDYPIISKMTAKQSPQFIGMLNSQLVQLQKKVMKKIKKNFLDEYSEENIESKLDFTQEDQELKSVCEKFRESLKEKQLFKGLKFYLNRQVPKNPLQLIIYSYGGEVVGIDGEEEDSEVQVNDNSITHHVVDRDLSNEFISKYENRQFIQPQWILDCINHKVLLPVSQYAAGKALPPHLSPFVDNEEEGYIPTRQKEINSIKGVGYGEVGQQSDGQEDQEEEEQEEESDEEEDEDDDQGDQEDSQDMKMDVQKSSDDDEQDDEILEKVAQFKEKRNDKIQKRELGKMLMSNRQQRLYRNLKQETLEKKKRAQSLQKKRKILQK